MTNLETVRDPATRADGVEDLLNCPRTGQGMRLSGGAYVSEADPRVTFPIEEGIVRAFVPHEPTAGDVSEAIKVFYEENPFPNYEGMEDVGSLIEKSVGRGFPEMLNRSIRPGATVLEVGCGTGQLGSFLSISSRRVLSVDLCWNSLRLGERFRRANGLPNITFAQMNLFRLPLERERFDVVICTGVLHHTASPRSGFMGLVSLVRPGGHVLVGLYNRYGRRKTRWRRQLAKVFGERVAALDPYISTY
ncbi:MAG: class I SAM-dependent methyltransferase, partial [Vicinamibacteria bacterium]